MEQRNRASSIQPAHQGYRHRASYNLCFPMSMGQDEDIPGKTLLGQKRGEAASDLLSQEDKVCQHAVMERFNIPQKLSKSTLFRPCSQRTSTSVWSFAAGRTSILNDSAGSSSSSSSSVSERSALSAFFCFLLAARDQTSALVAPMPVARRDRYCQRKFRGSSMLFKRWATNASDALRTRKLYSEGNGRRCLGKLDMLRATF